ncbi:MAG TPA: hypothetical protein VM692_00910, partial [Gammaproteobacteria bacterium]|nr:hypothetical protein [Gammaproteobacteria bacterium]
MATTPTMLERERSHARLAAYWLPACTLALAPVAYADLLFEPRVAVGVIHTDNLTLDSGDDPQAETVYEVVPSFRFEQESPRVSSSANYRVEGYRYSSLDADEVYNILYGRLRVEPDPDNFFLDLGASRDQAIRDLTAPIATSNLPISTNRMDRDEAYFGPSFTYPIGDNVTAGGQFRRTRVRYDEPETGFAFARDFDVDTTEFSLDNYQKELGFTWATRYSAEKTEYAFFPSYEYRQAAVEIGAWLGQRVRLFGTKGKESAWDTPFDPSLEDDFWEVGVATRDNDRFTAEVATGER